MSAPILAPGAMRLVVVESPFAAPTPEGISANIDYARRCLTHCLGRGEAPIASHLLYTQPGVLNDQEPAERALGIAAGFAWGAFAEVCAVYTDRGISKGMRMGIEAAEAAGIPVEYRQLQGD